jgi:membrane protein DedA with SNARE-associated domain
MHMFHEMATVRCYNRLDVNGVVSNAGLLASQNLFLAYFIIYVATILLGNVAAFVSFWVVFQGHFASWGIPALIATIFVADLTGDLLWYSLGRATRDTRLGNWIRKRLPSWHNKVEGAFENNGRKWIVLSKFVYASVFPIIFSAGWSKMEFKKFLRNSLISIAVWLPVLLGLTYALASGLSPLLAVSLFRHFELAFFIGLALFIFLDYLLAKFIGKILAEENKEEEMGRV